VAPWKSRNQAATAEQSVAFLLFAVVAAVTPGPSNIMLTAAGAQAGILRGLPCLLGERDADLEGRDDPRRGGRQVHLEKDLALAGPHHPGDLAVGRLHRS
jgi:hypothetical protein